MHTLTFTTATARALAKARRAIAATDKEKLSSWERRNRADELDPNVATLQITGETNLTVPIRCDILAKWTAAHDLTVFDMVVDDSLAVTIRANGSTLKLLAPQVPAGVLPFIARMSAEFGSCEIVPDFDVKTACLTARSLRTAKAEAKAAGEQARELAESNRGCDEYRQALEILTPANIRKAAKQTRSLRQLRAWARCLAPIIDSLPNPLTLCSAADSPRELDPILFPDALQSYAHAWQAYEAAKARHDNYAPKSYYAASKERPKRAEAMHRAGQTAKQCLGSGIADHCAAFGIGGHVSAWGMTAPSDVKTYLRYESIGARVSAARKVVRKYRAGIADTFALSC
jgi:hypothetical protein